MRRYAMLFLLALAGCGSVEWDAQGLQKHIRAKLASQGMQVGSVRCPKNVKIAKGVVTYCTATLGDGNTLPFRVTQSNDTGRVHYAQSELIAEQSQSRVQALLAQQRQITATATCPDHVGFVVGREFECIATERSGRQLRFLGVIDGPTHVSFRLLGYSRVAGRAFETDYTLVVGQFNQIGDAIVAALRQAGSQSDAQIADTFRSLASTMHDQRGKLETLTPPSNLATDFNSINSATGRLESDLKAIAVAAAAHRGAAAGRRLLGSLKRDFVASRSAFARLDRKLGIG